MMLPTFLKETEQSSLWFVLLLCVLLLLWTVFMCSLPMMCKLSQNGLSYVSALGAGLMVGAAFNVVIPESIDDALEQLHLDDTPGAELAAFRLIGICITCGFAFMMICDSLTHKCSHHDHGHGHHHEEHHEEQHEEHHEEAKDGNNVAVPESAPAESDPNASEKKVTHHSYQSTVWGLCLHSIFDGISIGASMLAKDSSTLWIIFFAIVLHKSSASIGLGAYFKKLGLTYKKSFLYIFIFSATTPLATFLAALLVKLGTEISGIILPIAFAFSSGTFLYVAITHILPEIGANLKPAHLISMFIGVVLPYFLFIEHDE